MRQLIDNIKKSKYSDVFKYNNLQDKYTAFVKVDKGHYYAGLSLAKLIRTTSLIDSPNEEKKTDHITKLVDLISKDKYELFIKNILNIINSEYLTTRERKLLIFLSLENEILPDNVTNWYVVDTRKNYEKLKNKGVKEKFKYLGFNRPSTYYEHINKVIKKIINKLEEEVYNV